jgi:hypothetical protein
LSPQTSSYKSISIFPQPNSNLNKFLHYNKIFTIVTLLRFASWTKCYDQDLKKNEENEIEVHYLSIETKISATRHKQHSEIHFKFRHWDGCQMVNT